jgi:hypothetical protein
MAFWRTKRILRQKTIFIGAKCQAVRHSEQMPGALPMQQNASQAAAHSSGKVLSAAPSLFRIDAAS